ncbi:MAG: diguanylate cyclase [Deltaproteobacteria bacterium]|nr:diguanylate cyclase [Deltaproteobacteria bacterium]MDQ3298189.1 diguanylate cyclase [Myxococcota bacterium]
MGAGTSMRDVIVLHASGPADADLVQALRGCGASVRFATTAQKVVAVAREQMPEVVVIELGPDDALLAELAAGLPPTVRLIVIGDPRSMVQGGATPDCVMFSHPDESVVCDLLRPGMPANADLLLRELLTLTVFGVSLPETLQEMAARLARAFDADDCVIVLSEEATCYTARGVSEEVLADLEPLCETVCQFATTVIAPPRPDRPYQAFLGVPLGHDNAPPIALVLLCREQPVPFAREALGYLRALATRLSADLSWRIVHERLLADRDKLRELSRIDPVLGVANRTALQEELSRRVAASERRGEPFSVAVVDVDGLRLINERHGYPAGDSVLTHIAQVARLEARAQDIVARYAGDSIAIVMPGAAAEEATEILTRILSAVDATPVLHEKATINLTVSAGIAEVDYEDDTGEAALGRAMAARERARLHGEVIALASDDVVDAAPQPDFQIGNTLGGVYQLRHEISRGAFGVVYRAEDLALGRQVALKLLRPDLARDTVFVENFRHEAATLARIRHPNLVQVYAFGVDGANVYFAMELVEGQGLDQRIHSARQRRRHMPIPEVLSIIDQVSDALEAVHRAGMLHRDVKPENVLFDRIHRRCVLVDVGIAVRRGEKNPAGTPGFTAPEVFGSGREAPATDVYSLGALAYMLLTLQAPFGDASPIEVLELQAANRPRPLTEIRRDLSEDVDAVLLPTLDPDPAKRPQSARELAKALTSALQDATPRRTMERPTAEVIEVRRPITVHNSSARGALQAVPNTRGVLFRAVYEVLGARRGAAWVADVSRRYPELALALAPQSSALAWHPTSAFISVLESLGASERECSTIAMQLGRTTVDASFDQFYGADLSAASPAQVLRSADLFWRCYHTWGTASVNVVDTDAEVTVTDGIANAILCASTAGILAGVVGRSGGLAVELNHDTCLAKGADHCMFRLTWRMNTEVDPGNIANVRFKA